MSSTAAGRTWNSSAVLEVVMVVSVIACSGEWQSNAVRERHLLMRVVVERMSGAECLFARIPLSLVR